MNQAEKYENKYDVIIIGAGNGGLATAVTVARLGLRPLVIERNSVPGGCATSIRRGRFEFEPSLHELANVGTDENPGSIRAFFDSIGAAVEWYTEDTLFRVIADGEDGYDVTLPVGIDTFCDTMERLVPGCRDSVEKFFGCVEKVNRGIAYLGGGRVDSQVLATEHADFMRLASHSVDEVLDVLQMPKRAQNIMKTYWCYLGAPTNELDFAHYGMMFERYVKFRPAMPRYRSHELSLALEKAIRDNGGDIWYNTEVREILVKDNKACGVVANGKEIYANCVVANCFPEVAYTQLINRNEVPERALQLCSARESGPLFFTVYLGLNRTAEEIGIKDYSVFLYGSPDAGKQFESCGDTDNSMMIVNCLNRVIPDSSPEGTCTLFLTTMLTEEAWGDVKAEDYKRVKNRIAGRLIATYENKLGIEITPYIEEIVIAAPPTFARYLNTPNGTPYGYRLQPWDTMINRIMHVKNESPIQGLYFTGAHAERGDGYSSTYAQGIALGNRIRKEVGAYDK